MVTGICIGWIVQQAIAIDLSRMVLVQQRELTEVKAQTEKTRGSLTRFLRWIAITARAASNPDI